MLFKSTPVAACPCSSKDGGFLFVGGLGLLLLQVLSFNLDDGRAINQRRSDAEQGVNVLALVIEECQVYALAGILCFHAAGAAHKAQLLIFQQRGHFRHGRVIVDGLGKYP